MNEEIKMQDATPATPATDAPATDAPTETPAA
jgi:hypothetical protein